MARSYLKQPRRHEAAGLCLICDPAPSGAGAGSPPPASIPAEHKPRPEGLGSWLSAASREGRKSAPIPKFDDRFARQNRCEPPPEFPLASPYSGIVHHLSGPNSYARTQIHPKTSGSVDDAPLRVLTSVHFHYAHGFDTQTLA
ncbi:hypothetical protein P7C71_g5823, partial [Lecanoromycetidae sp. Uapishka_2]